MKRLPFLPQFEEENIKLLQTNRFEWVESTVDLDGAASREVLGVSIQPWKIHTFFLSVCCILLIMLGRIGYLQLFQGENFSLLAQHNKIRTHIVPAQRGVLFDMHGVSLVRNVPNFTLEITSADLPKDESQRNAILESLARILKKSPRDFLAVAHANPYQPSLIAENIPYETALQLEVIAADMPAVAVNLRQRREYTTAYGSTLSHIIGYTGRVTKEELEKSFFIYDFNDSIGKSGLEYTYESVLRGKHGKKQVEVDALGHEKRVLSEEKAVDGSNIVTTIDGELQKKAEDVLRARGKSAGGTRGVVILSDPKNGAIRALVSMPGFNANAFAKGIAPDEYRAILSDREHPLINRAIQAEYPSGSTIKPLVAGAALQEGIVASKTVLVSTGGIRIGEWFFPDWKTGGHGRTTVVKALAESVNTFFYLISGGSETFKGLGIVRLVDYFYRFGLGERTGVDLLGEQRGFVPTPDWKKKKKGEQWYIGDTYHTAIGQGDVLVTPLQVNLFTMYFANRGVNYRPFLFDRIQDEHVIVSPKGVAVFREGILSQSHVDTIREGLFQAVRGGSARQLSLLPVSSAGKTGTAQWHAIKKPHAWFTGWAPYENPEIVITVLVEEGGEGSRLAIPIAYDILQWYFGERIKKSS